MNDCINKIISDINIIPNDVVKKFTSSNDYVFLKNFFNADCKIVSRRDNHVIISEECEEKFIEIENKWNLENPNYDFILLCIKTL